MNQLRNKDNSTIDWVDDATDELTQNKNNKIGIRGVVQSGESFLAIITVKYKKIYLGRFATPEQAGAEYLKHKKLMHKGWSSRGI